MPAPTYVNQWPRARARDEREHRDLAEHPGPHDQHPLVLGLARDPRHASRPTVKDKAGVLGPFATDHFYPLARTCAERPVPLPDDRAPPVPGAHGQLRLRGLHCTPPRRRVAGCATGWTRRTPRPDAGRRASATSRRAPPGRSTRCFNAACPQPPDQPGANADCHLGATGVNVHNAEVRAYFFPQEGNAYYNAIRYDPTRRGGHADPRAVVLRAAAVRAARPRHDRPAPGRAGRDPGVPVTAWEVRTDPLGATRVPDQQGLGGRHGQRAGTPALRRDRPDDALRPHRRGPDPRRARHADRRSGGRRRRDLPRPRADR